MRSADTILGIIRERGKRGLPLEDIYRQLYNPNLYLLAYARLYANKGALTTGATSETVDAMSLRKIDRLIDDLRHERHRWTPVRRTYVPKKNGKLRPLGLPTWTDKLLQDVIRLILDAYYEPQFSPHSHGFRPDRGCHTALSEGEQTWTGTKWFIEGDIRACFDRLDKDVLVGILRDRVHDNRFIRLIQQRLDAGYLEDWRYHPTLSGCPQGGVCSPVLSNIYLDRLDTYVAEHLLPAYTRGDKRQRSPLYYLLAQNVSWLWDLHRVMRSSLLKTLAHKHKGSVAKIARKYRALAETPHGPLRCLQITVPREGKPPLVARYGGLPLRRQAHAALTDLPLTIKRRPARSKLLTRLLADTCEVCGSTEQVEVHHVRKLADLNRPGRADKPWWAWLMAARRRKTLVVCRACHQAIHAGRPHPHVRGAG